MRITSNSQYLQSVYSSSLQKTAETTESTSTTETLDNEAILEKLKEQIKARTYENSSDYGDLIASGQMAKMNFRIQPVEESGDTSSMEALRTSFDTIRDSDIESLSAEDASALLTSLQSSLDGTTSPDGSFEAISQLDVSSLTESQVKEALSSIQTRALETSSKTEKSENGMRPMGPPPMGPPPGAEGTTSTETEETTALETLEALLERLSEEDDDETLSSIEELLSNWTDKILALKNSKTESAATTTTTASEA